MPITLICQQCGKAFTTKPCLSGRKYCSRKCFYSSAIGSKRSQKTRQKMSKAIAKTHWTKFQPYPESLKEKLRIAMTGNTNALQSGIKITSTGYRAIYIPIHPLATKSNYVLEHRLVAEKALGRYLDTKEVVHHLDGNTLNNVITNLFVFENFVEHFRYHKLRLSHPFLYSWLKSNLIP